MSWGGLLFAALGVVLLGGVGMCWYEAYALIAGKTTISSLVASSFADNPHTYILGVFVAGVILGALVTHFTNWSAA